MGVKGLYKWCHRLLNGLALLLMAASVAVGAVRENSLIAVGLTALGTIVKGWNDFKKFSFKVDVSLCLHHLREDSDQTEALRPRLTLGGIRGVSRQDADPQ